MKKLFLSLAVLLCAFSVSAKADIFNPIGPAKPYKAFLNSVNGVSPNGQNTLNTIAAIVDYLGVIEGEAYNVTQRKWVTTSGATIISYTPWNLALQAIMLNTDGAVGSIAWNIGAYLPSQNVPIMSLTQYLYIQAGAGVEADANGALKFAWIVGPEFKFSF